MHYVTLCCTFDFLDLAERLACALVCSDWRRAANSVRLRLRHGRCARWKFGSARPATRLLVNSQGELVVIGRLGNAEATWRFQDECTTLDRGLIPHALE